MCVSACLRRSASVWPDKHERSRIQNPENWASFHRGLPTQSTQETMSSPFPVPGPAKLIHVHGGSCLQGLPDFVPRDSHAESLCTLSWLIVHGHVRDTSYLGVTVPHFSLQVTQACHSVMCSQRIYLPGWIWAGIGHYSLGKLSQVLAVRAIPELRPQGGSHIFIQSCH